VKGASLASKGTKHSQGVYKTSQRGEGLLSIVDKFGSLQRLPLHRPKQVD
jgi:hypothetical protein